MTSPKWRNIVSAGLVLLCLAACGGESTGANGPSDSAANKPLQKVKFGFAIPSVSPEWAYATSVPLENGYWKQSGLDVEIVPQNGATTALTLLAAGKTDVAIAGSISGYQLIEKGAKIKWVASLLNQNTTYPAVLEKSDISSVDDFRGKKVGLISLTASQGIWLDALLKEHGMTRKDLGGVVAVGTGAQALRALETGRVDVYYANAGEYERFEAISGVPMRALNNDKVFTDNPGILGLWVRDDELSTKGPIISGLIEGIAKGLVYSLTNTKAATAIHYSAYPEVVPKDLSREDAVNQESEIMGAYLGQPTLDAAKAKKYGDLTATQAGNLAKLLQDAGLLKSAQPGDVYFDNRFIADANKFDVQEIVDQAGKADWQKVASG